jgi:hypothetical protein
MAQEQLSPGLKALLQRENLPPVTLPQVKHFQFVLIIADDRNPGEVPGMIREILQILVQQHACISDITSSLIVALLGVPFPENNSADARRALVDALLRESGNRIRIIHGECDGVVGMLGGPERWTYGAVIPGFSEILKKLLETRLGAAVEIS